MKYLLLVLLTAISFDSEAQLTYEFIHKDHRGVDIFKIDDYGKKFIGYDTSDKAIKIYNSDHSVFKSIITGLAADDQVFKVSYPSQYLFNSDTKIEALLHYQTSLGQYRYLLLNEDGNLLQSFDDATNMVAREIDGKWFFIVHVNGSYQIFSAPGTYTGILPLKPGAEEEALETSIAPNPLHNTARISYQLPVGATLGTIDVINQAGQQVRTYQVSNAFSDILISKDDLPAGMYLYRVNAGTYSSAPQKFIIQ